MTEILLSLALFGSDFAALDAPTWRERDAAARRLADAGCAASPGAEWLAATSPSPEVRARCADIAARSCWLPCPDEMPWLCDPERSPIVWWGDELQEYRAAAGWWGGMETGYAGDRHAAYLWARDQIRHGVPRQEIEHKLHRMRCVEAEWWGFVSGGTRYAY